MIYKYIDFIYHCISTSDKITSAEYKIVFTYVIRFIITKILKTFLKLKYSS